MDRPNGSDWKTLFLKLDDTEILVVLDNEQDEGAAALRATVFRADPYTPEMQKRDEDAIAAMADEDIE